LTLAVAPRLVELFRRSFPEAAVCAYAIRTEGGSSILTAPVQGAKLDAWAPMGALAARFRSSLASFESGGPYLQPDPEAGAYWRRRLKQMSDQPKVGISWKSLKTSGHRSRRYAPFKDWEPVLRTPGVSFVNLQYGDCRDEIAAAATLGVDILQPEPLDLTNDIDAAAALSSAMDLVIGVGNASTNLAAAVGAPSWFVFPPTAWPRLGADGHPWFGQTRGFAGKAFGDWPTVMGEVAEALTRELARPR